MNRPTLALAGLGIACTLVAAMVGAQENNKTAAPIIPAPRLLPEANGLPTRDLSAKTDQQHRLPTASALQANTQAANTPATNAQPTNTPVANTPAPLGNAVLPSAPAANTNQYYQGKLQLVGNPPTDPAARTANAGSIAPVRQALTDPASKGVSSRRPSSRRIVNRSSQPRTAPPSRSAQPTQPVTTQPAASPTAVPVRPASRSITPQAAPQQGVAPTSTQPAGVRPVGGSAPATQPNGARPVGPATQPTTASPSDQNGPLAVSSAPAIEVTTLGPKSVILGEEVPYVISVFNQTETPARDILVRITVPDNLQVNSANAEVGHTKVQQDNNSRFLLWTIDSLADRTRKSLTLKVAAQNAQPFELAVDWQIYPPTAVARVKVQQPMLQVDLKGASDILYGETKVYSVIVSNPGTGDAKNVEIYLALGEKNADKLAVGTIKAGEKKQFDVEVTARQLGVMKIQAVVVGANGLKDEALNQLKVRRASLVVTPLGPKAKYADSIGTYQITVKNTGNASAKGILAAAKLPKGVKYIRGIDAEVNKLTEGITWQIGDLSPGSERVYRFYCELTAPGNNEFQFGVRSKDGVESVGVFATRVEALADLKLTVNDPKGPLPIDESVTYEIQITNRGTKAAEQVSVFAQFSKGIEPVELNGAQGQIVPGQAVFKPLARIVPGETIRLQVKAKASQAGNHIFRAVVECAKPETRLAAEDTTRFFGDDLLGEEATTGSLQPATPAPATPATPSPATPSPATPSPTAPSGGLGPAPVAPTTPSPVTPNPATPVAPAGPTTPSPATPNPQLPDPPITPAGSGGGSIYDGGLTPPQGA